MSSATMIAPKNYAATMTASKNYRAGNKHYDRTRQGVQKASAYCKVCHDAGRPRHEYTSHFVKDKKGPDGKVVCPLLLNQECRYCHEKGHTPKQCPEIKAKAERKREYEQRQREFRSRPDSNGFRAVCSHQHTRYCQHQAPKTRRAAHEALTAKLKPTNLFAELQESSSDEEESKTSDDFPTLISQPAAPAVVVPSEPELTGWAMLAAKPAAAQPKHVVHVQMPPLPTVTQDVWDNDSTAATEDEEEEIDEDRAEWNEEFKQMKGASWADLCDSDNEKEE